MSIFLPNTKVTHTYILAVSVILALAASSTVLGQATVICGKVLGYDGKPLPQADVLWKEGSNSTSFSRITADRDGSFTLVTYFIGGLKVFFTGVGHFGTDYTFLIRGNDSIEVNVYLPTPRYRDSFDSVKAIGDFNGFDFDSAQPMREVGDGTYRLSLKIKTDTLGYQLINVAKAKPGHLIRSVNGTNADRYSYEDDEDYVSIIDVNADSVTIIFDPKRLPPQGKTASIRVEDRDSINNKFASLYKDMLANRKLPEMEDLQRETLAKLLTRIHGETDTFTRSMLLLSYLDLPAPRRMKDSSVGKMIIKEISVTNPLWGLNGNWVYTSQFLAGIRKYEQYQQRVQEFIRVHPDTNLRTYLLKESIRGAEREGKVEDRDHYYSTLLSLYENTHQAGFVRSQYGKDGKVVIGNPVPYFQLELLDDASTIMNPDSLKGHTYLIDFWAAWCAPCIEEMENLHDMYDRYRGKGFRILSISLDSSPKTVEMFRAQRWKMPWFNAIDTSGVNGVLARKFDLFGLPRPILVGPDGIVIAVEGALRGKNLRSTLDDLFEKRELTE